MFTLINFEILQFKDRLVLWPAQQIIGSEKIKFLVKDQNNVRLLLELLEKWLSYKRRRFWMVFNVFWLCLTHSVPEKSKNPIFEIPVTPQTFGIND